MQQANHLATHLGQTPNSFDNLAGSFEHRLLPGAGRFHHLGIGADELPPLTVPDGATRRPRGEEPTQ